MARKKPKTSPPIKAFGAKFYLASSIVDLFPRDEYITLLDPMFRTGSIVFAHDPEGKSEVINDIDHRITNLFYVLSIPELFEDFVRMACVLSFNGQSFERAVEEEGRLGEIDHEHTHDDEKVSRALNYFVINRMSHMGEGEHFATLTRKRLRRGMNEQASAFLSAVDNLPKVHERLRRVLVLPKLDVFDLIPEWDDPTVLQYLDPPYLIGARAVKKAYGANDWTLEDHERLMGILREIKSAKIFISGKEHALYKNVLETELGWKRHEFGVSLSSSGAKTKRRDVEIVWTNYRG